MLSFLEIINTSNDRKGLNASFYITLHCKSNHYKIIMKILKSLNRISWLVVLLAGTSLYTSYAQEKGSVSVGGYMQILGQMGNATAPFSVGKVVTTDGWASRMGIRRGQFFASGKWNHWVGRAEIIVNESSVTPYSVYLRGTSEAGHFVQVGLSPLPFGFELPYSSRQRPTWERSNYIRELFPAESDFFLQFHAQKSWQEGRHELRGDVAFLSGEVHQKMNRTVPNFLGRVEMKHSFASANLLYGISGYTGGISGTHLVRNYLGSHAVVDWHNSLFSSKVSVETICGYQPGTLDTPSITGRYQSNIKEGYLCLRPFWGSTLLATCRHNSSSLEGVLKYVYYNRNNRYRQGQSTSLSNPDRTMMGSDRYDGTSHTAIVGATYYVGKEDKLKVSLLYECNLYEHKSYSIYPLEDPLTHLLTLGVQYTL